MILIENLYIPQREKTFFSEKHMKNCGQFLQTYWSRPGSLDFVNMKWTTVYTCMSGAHARACTSLEKKIFYQSLSTITHQAGALKFHLIKLKM